MKNHAYIVALATFHTLASGNDIRFATTAIDIPANPVEVLAFDTDSDGRDEIVLFYSSPARYIILKADPSGRLIPAAPVIFATSTLDRVRAADINNDGRTDIVAFSSPLSVFHLLLAQGDGTFAPSPDSPLPGGSSRLFALGDLNNDGLPEILIRSDSRVDIYQNLGSGRFATPSFFQASHLGGLFEIAVATTRPNMPPAIGLQAQSGNRLHVYHRTGPALNDYQAVQEIFLPAQGNSVAVWDIGSQGQESFVINDVISAALMDVQYDIKSALYVSRIGPSPAPTQTNTGFAISRSTSQPRRAAFSFSGSGTLRILTNNRQGAGQFEESTQDLGGFFDLRKVLFADLSGNGSEHVVAINTDRLMAIDPGSAGNFTQAGATRTLAYTPNQLVPFPSRPGTYLAATTETTELSMLVAEHSESGFNITTEVIPSVFGAPNQPRWAIADINADGLDDIIHIASATQNNRVRWQLQEPGGGYSSPQEVLVSTGTISNLVTADLNNDSHADAVVLLLNGTASILYGQPDGQLSQPQNVPLSPFSGPGSLLIADLDQDGMLDIICANRSNSTATAAIQVAYATGPMSYASPVAFPAPVQAGSTTGGLIDAADINGDGILDIAISTTGGNAFVLLSNGARSYNTPLLVASAPNTSALQFKDLDDDAVSELIVTRNDRTLIFRYSNTDLFSNRFEFFHHGPAPRIVFEDLNGDSLPEAVVTASNAASILANRSNSICIADYLADGVLDFFDIAAFLTDFSNHVPRTDLNNDGAFNFFDITIFLRAFTTNCR